MASNFIRKSMYSAYENFRGYHTLKCLNKIRRTQWLPEEKIKKIQWIRLEKLLKHSYVTVPFYKNLFDSIGINIMKGVTIDDFRNIPLLDKEIITRNKEKLLSTKYKPSDLIVNTTSGSTGKKLVFYKDKKMAKNDDYYRMAAVLRNIEWTRAKIWDKQAYLWGSQMDSTKEKRFKGRMLNFIFPTLFLSSYEMTPYKMNLYVKKINRYKPKVLTGYASALYLFANFLDEKQIKIHNLKGIVSSAETLYQYQRDKIESVFQCKVFNRYGCREVGPIAQECTKHTGLHINAEHVYVEILDENGNPCHPGKIGKIVVTDLDNYGFPFIRYEIGDIGIFSDRKCECGRNLPLLENVGGRVFDIIVGTNGNHLTGTFWTILLRTYVQGIVQFQVIQENFGEIVIKLVVDKSFTETEEKKLLKRIYDKCGEDMKVDIQLVKNIPLTESGKNRFIISKVSPFVNKAK